MHKGQPAGASPLLLPQPEALEPLGTLPPPHPLVYDNGIDDVQELIREHENKLERQRQEHHTQMVAVS